MNKYLLKMLLATVLVCISPIGFSEDIELYISDVVRQAGKSTKVLIIFDNSGSMGTTHKVQEKFDADPNVTYPPEGAAHAYNDNATYFNKGGADNSSAIPSSPSDARRFLGDINSCETSKAILRDFGFYTGRIREYSFKGNSGKWNEIPDNNGLNIEVLDCEDDAYIEDTDGNIQVGDRTNANGVLPGYPVNGMGTKKLPEPHDNSTQATTTNVDWASGGYVTLYTAKYLRWFYGQSVNEVTETRMQTAKGSITSVINTTPSVDFGLEVFNYNDGDGSNDGNGGRIALGIKKMTTTNKANLLDVINNELSPDTWTPLCESVYEASQYFAGSGIEFGDDDINVGSWYSKNRPPMDPDVIRSGNNYVSPFNNCASSIAHIILITDGEPTNDFGADSKITGMSTTVLRVDGDGTPILDANGDFIYDDKLFIGSRYTDDGSNSYLPALAGWMSEYDINPNLDGEQTVVTHTIGFSEGADGAEGLLRETAKRGKGQYFAAKSGLQLTQALISILNKLPQSNDSLTSASVAANNFDRTQTLDSVYYAMFEPQTGARWQGNLKKYRAKGGELTGVGGANAICEIDGRSTFCPTAQSYWSPEIDGDIVGKGGVVAWFNSKKPTDRKLYMESGPGALIDFNRTNLEIAFTDTGVTGAEGLAAELGVAGFIDGNGDSIESAAIDEMLAWAAGADVDDENNDGIKTDMRADVFGDPLHSKPLVINYGSSIRILIGTNSGALHMFKDSGATVEESWAFMPKEFVDNIKPLRDNYSSANKIYGIDGEISVYQNDKNGDGVIDGTDTAWIFFGLRRGGSSYYAVDITLPDAPKLMWHIDSGTTGFSELGQSWSKPKLGFSKLNVSGKIASPVLFIGGGYDVNKDSAGVVTPDSKGRGVYMLDAMTGTILWSALPLGGTTTFLGTDSIASPIGLLDSTSNGLVDRLYVGDTGGNIWRFDLPDKGKNIDKADFSVFKLATLGGGADDQRFFYEPTIVRTYISEVIETTVSDGSGATKTITVHQKIPYDAVLIGSGDRSNPLGKDTADTLYMIKDSNIISQTFSSSTVPPTPLVINKNDLYDYTDDPFDKSMTTQEEETLQLAVSQKSGWYIDLVQSGEKSTSAALVNSGIVYFTTYIPAEIGAVVDCKPPEGGGWLYVVDLSLGVRKHHSTKDVRTDDKRVFKINNDWLGPPTVIVLPVDDNDASTIDDTETYNIIGYYMDKAPNPFNTRRTYLYSTEQQ